MRAAFVETLIRLARQDQRILLLTGDLGYTVLEPFCESFPDRFFNVGVAEQNMLGMSTGLAKEGFIPFVYSISTFAVLRPCEFIRNGPILHRLPVRLVGVGGGFDYGYAGITHYALEDIGIMRIQKGITTVVPADYLQAQTALLSTWDLPGPVYYRIAKDEISEIANLNGQFELGRVNQIREGRNLVFVSMGGITQEVITAADILFSKGISSSIVVVSSFNPSPIDDLIRILTEFRFAVTVEDHYVTGGLGSFIAEIVAENELPCKVIRCAVENLVDHTTARRGHMLDKYGISSHKLTEKVLHYLEKLKI